MTVKTFISYHHENDQWAKEYISALAAKYQCFQDVSVSVGDIDDDHRSSQSIRRIIRDAYLRDSKVTILLCGTETKGRKHVDWELKSSMIDGAKNGRSGILVITLPSTLNEKCWSAYSNEKSIIYPDIGEEPGNWIDLEYRSHYQEWWPELPSRIVDNLVEPGVRISVVPWSRVFNKPYNLKWLIEATAFWGPLNRYNLKSPMRRNNSGKPRAFGGY